ncbi:hypothetical protein KTQ90_13395, partial [Prevotella stercorea]|nr:hypothetical protein [Leyella stercorea]
TLVNRSFLAIRHILAEFFGKNPACGWNSLHQGLTSVMTTDWRMNYTHLCQRRISVLGSAL